MTVECSTQMRLAAHQAANADGIAVHSTLRIDDGGVVAFDTVHHEPLVPWLHAFEAYHFTHCRESHGERKNSGTALMSWLQGWRQCAIEWAEFGVQTAESAIAALNSGDPDAFIGMFSDNATFQGIDVDAARELIAIRMASGTQWATSSCADLFRLSTRPPRHW